jgi:hypothetical protein
LCGIVTAEEPTRRWILHAAATSDKPPTTIKITISGWSTDVERLVKETVSWSLA